MRLVDKLGFGPKREHWAQSDGSYLVSVTPPAFMNLPKQTVKLNSDQYRRYCDWFAGQGLIQEKLFDLSADQREILQSGIGPEDFAKLYSEEE